MASFFILFCITPFEPELPQNIPCTGYSIFINSKLVIPNGSSILKYDQNPSQQGILIYADVLHTYLINLLSITRKCYLKHFIITVVILTCFCNFQTNLVVYIQSLKTRNIFIMLKGQHTVIQSTSNSLARCLPCSILNPVILKTFNLYGACAAYLLVHVTEMA